MPDIDAVLFDLDGTVMPDVHAVDASIAAVASEWLATPRKVEAFVSATRRIAREFWRRSPFWSTHLNPGLGSYDLLWMDLPEEGERHEWHLWIRGFRQRTWACALEFVGEPCSLWSAISEAFIRERKLRCAPYAGTREMLSQLRASYQLAIVTNGIAALQRLKLDLAKLDGLFNATIISGEVGARKPDPRIFLTATAALRVKPARCVMVGDSPVRDMGGAKSAGLRTIWVMHDRHIEDIAMPRYRPDEAVRRPAHVARALTRLASGNPPEADHGSPSAP